MMSVNPAFQRLALLAGADTVTRLSGIRVAVFGAGGVGSWCAEALARSAVGHITLVDSDAVCVTNINRQVEATAATVGEIKVDALARRLRDINPALGVRPVGRVFTGARAAEFGIETMDYVIDAIDSLGPKLDLIEYTTRAGVTLYSSMGMAQKLDAGRIKTAGIWQTEGCPLARLVRQGLRKRGFTGDFTAVYSAERLKRAEDVEVSCGSERCFCPARNRADPDAPVEWCSSKKTINGSAVTVTATAGMLLAGLVLRDVYRRVSAGEKTDTVCAGAPRGEAAAVSRHG
ncbi:MAG: tRNA threonylcarbamoyladenosine dehydratase [Spirochaetaceae bacterium]|jgi:tRNA A37 threonylcarbamoyladenosine dehydratase|nr:tRNA threonylcarbamoyladenosine dehydratase [Spirochaetaceae bacterium]